MGTSIVSGARPRAFTSSGNEMLRNNKPQLGDGAVAAWLHDHLGSAPAALQPLAGGFWSAAFAFEHNNEQFVVRFNENADGFQIDQAAYEFASSGLPIPQVFEIGEALDLSYAISRRHHGRFLETVHPAAAPRLAPALANLFRQFRQVQGYNRVEWYDPSSQRSWHDYLLRGIGHQAGRPRDGIQKMLASRPELNDLHQSACARIHELLPLCPERRDLIHGDLLHQNVLVSDQADGIQAVFSWKCSAFGDFVYDIAWCTHWAPWHPGIAAIDFFDLTLSADDLDSEARDHLSERHHCYELQIAASHIGWYLWTRDEENLARLARGLRERLDNGPRSTD